MVANKDAALLIVGHGSTVNPDSSTPTWSHAREIQKRNIFADVRCAFWKEEPSLRDARFFFADRTIREVFVVPNFISEGYFTQTVIPRELELKGPVTTRANGQTWIYCEPVGNNPIVTELLLARAHEIAPDVEPTETALLIVAHGTELNDNSAIAAKREAERIRARGEFASVGNAYMEEPPLIADWDQLTTAVKCDRGPVFYRGRFAQLRRHPEIARHRVHWHGRLWQESTSNSGAIIVLRQGNRDRSAICRYHH